MSEAGTAAPTYGTNSDKVGNPAFPVIPDLIRDPATRRLPVGRLFSAQGLGLAGYRIKSGMTAWGMLMSTNRLRVCTARTCRLPIF